MSGYQTKWTTNKAALGFVWSQKVCWKCIFQGSGDLNVKIFPFTAHHGGTSWDTDLVKSTETKSREKTAVDKSACIKACKYI